MDATWFVVREVADGVWLIAEPPHVNSWLVLGRDRGALLDTGLGVRPIRPIVEQLTPLPVVVLNTHSHFDHVGGNHEFDEIWIHRLGAALLEAGVPDDLLAGYVEYASDMEAAVPAYVAADRRFFFSLTELDSPRPFSIELAKRPWRIPASTATGVLADGQRVDLGGRELTVIETPGHSPDHLSFLLEREGILFAGDAISTGAIYAQWPESDPIVFASSTEQLAQITGSLASVCVHHFQRATAPPRFLRAVADGFADLVAGRGSYRENQDCAGQVVREAIFDEFSIFVPQEQRDAIDGR